MTRALIALLLLPAFGFAQDMPLFTWVKNGQGWAKGASIPLPAKPEAGTLSDSSSTKQFTWKEGVSDLAKGTPLCAVSSKDGGTVFVGFADRVAVWAYQVKQDGTLINGDAYAPLRVRQGYDNSKEAIARLKANPPSVKVTSLLRDSAGRIYADTSLGVQVFDPTGRPSGTLPLPGKGDLQAMAWNAKNKSLLTIWIDGQVWEREILAKGE
jgi:hypothetical protein